MGGGSGEAVQRCDLPTFRECPVPAVCRPGGSSGPGLYLLAQGSFPHGPQPCLMFHRTLKHRYCISAWTECKLLTRWDTCCVLGTLSVLCALSHISDPIRLCWEAPLGWAVLHPGLFWVKVPSPHFRALGLAVRTPSTSVLHQLQCPLSSPLLSEPVFRAVAERRGLLGASSATALTWLPPL